MSDLRKEATNLKALLAEAYNNGAKSSAAEISGLRAQLASARKALEEITKLWSGGSMFHAHDIARAALTDEEGKS